MCIACGEIAWHTRLPPSHHHQQQQEQEQIFCDAGARTRVSDTTCMPGRQRSRAAPPCLRGGRRAVLHLLGLRAALPPVYIPPHPDVGLELGALGRRRASPSRGPVATRGGTTKGARCPARLRSTNLQHQLALARGRLHSHHRLFIQALTRRSSARGLRSIERWVRAPRVVRNSAAPRRGNLHCRVFGCVGWVGEPRNLACLGAHSRMSPPPPPAPCSAWRTSTRCSQPCPW